MELSPRRSLLAGPTKEELSVMGRKDAVAKDYMRDPKIFADAFNYYLY